MQCNTMQCKAMQCNAMQCNAMQCNAMQYNTTNIDNYNCACYCELLLQNLKAMALQILCASYNILLCICIFITLLHIYLLIHVCFYTW